ncbi:MAG: hypothetical protein ABR555_15600 [Pyrinomonadaceae bacterium]
MMGLGRLMIVIGNKVVFTYDAYKRVTAITDSLNRQITTTYNHRRGYDRPFAPRG